MRSRESGVGKQTLVGAAADASPPAVGKQTLVQQLAVQRRAGADVAPEAVHQAAAAGVATPTTSFPHAGQIQRLFGPAHDVGSIQAHVGGKAAAACDDMGASAFATGNHVAFARSPDLHTAAHEAAHVVQQAQGVNLYGGVGATGDAYEQHADAVADRVVAGQSAADLLAAGPSGSGTSSAVQRDEKPAGAPAAAASDTVGTTWYVDYNVPGGKTKSLPERKGDDQMIVDQLKIDSNNRGPKDKPTILQGGNAAHAGRVYLGQATVPKGPGEVSAAVRYAKRSDFKVEVSLSPPAKTAAEKAALKQTQADVNTFVMGEIDSRGDYDQIAAEAQTQYQSQFEGKTLKVSVTPLGVKSHATEQLSAQAAEFNAQGDSTYAALIDPTGTQDTSVGWTSNESNEEGDGSSGGVGTKSSVEAGDSTKVALKTKIVTEFQRSLKTNVETIFKGIQQQVDADTDTHTKPHEESVTWKVGIEPDKGEKKDGDDDKKDSGGGGIVDKLEGLVSSGAKWIYNKGKGLVKKIPLVGDALSLAGSLWDGIVGRGKIEHDSTTTDGKTDTDSHSHTHTGGTEITSLASIATELTQKMITETSNEVERAVSTKVGLEVSTSAQVSKSSKKAGSHGASGTVVTHEVGKPQVLIKKLK
ncbi:MAG TPA: DUF4157 domain-containing protein [Kofleriaceae bacterium]|nr:DUF4157 domain-containing protein [Kofleriaceae bacterium]